MTDCLIPYVVRPRVLRLDFMPQSPPMQSQQSQDFDRAAQVCFATHLDWGAPQIIVYVHGRKGSSCHILLSRVLCGFRHLHRLTLEILGYSQQQPPFDFARLIATALRPLGQSPTSGGCSKKGLSRFKVHAPVELPTRDGRSPEIHTHLALGKAAWNELLRTLAFAVRDACVGGHHADRNLGPAASDQNL